MAEINTSLNSSDRFREARERYNAANAARGGEQMDGDSIGKSLLNYLSKQTQREVKKPTSSRKADASAKLPLPLPVVPIDNSALVEQIKTNDNLVKLNKNITSKLPTPLPIDDSRISRESTLQKISNNITTITHLLPKAMEQMTKHTDEILGVNKDASKLVEAEVKKTGWITQVVGQFKNYLKGIKPLSSLSEVLAKTFKPVTNYSKITSEAVVKMLDLQRFIATKPTEEARASIEGANHFKLGGDSFESENVGALKGMMGVIFPDGTKTRKAIEFTKGTAKLFDSIGKAAADKSVAGIMALSSTSIVTRILKQLPALTKALTHISKYVSLVGRLAGGLIGLVAFSGVYAAFRDPSQMGEYLSAFAKILNENLIPAFKWIATKLGPDLAAIGAIFMYVVDQVTLAVGTLVNKGAIKILKDVIPPLFTLIGRTISELYDGIRNFVLRFAGIFGYGPHANEGIIANILKAFGGMADSIMESIWQWFTAFIGLFVDLEIFGLKDGESIYGRIKRLFTEDLMNIINNAIAKIVSFFLGNTPDESIYDRIKRFFTEDLRIIIDNAITKSVEFVKSFNPVDMIYEKVQNLFSAIVDFIPSWDDIKKRLVDVMPSWLSDRLKGLPDKVKELPDKVKELPDRAKGWMTDRLSAPSTTSSSEQPSRMVAHMSEWKDRVKIPVSAIGTGIYSTIQRHQSNENLPMSPWERQAQQSVIFAPQTNNSSTTVVNSSGRGAMSYPVGNTRPDNDPLMQQLLRAQPL